MADRKLCTGCNQEKDLIDFFRKNDTKDGRQHRCKQCVYPILRKSKLKIAYGITPEEYEEMSSTCEICGRSKKKRSLHVDHDHKTGAVRGILCAECNRNIEWYMNNKDNINIYVSERCNV